MDYLPEPILAARLAAVLDDQLGEVGDFIGIHPQTSM